MIKKEFILKQGKPSTEDGIQVLESDLHITLPDDYKRFLFMYGDGGVTLINCVFKKTEDIIDVIGGIEHIKGGIEWLKEIESNRGDNTIVADMFIPIVKTETNEFYCINKDSKNTTVYRINFNAYDKSKIVEPIAKSFTDLINNFIYVEI